MSVGKRPDRAFRQNAGAGAEEFTAGTVLSQTFSVFFANFLPFTLITFLALLPVLAFTLLVATGTLAVKEPNTFFAIVAVLSLIVTPVATGAVTYGVVQQVRGKHASLGDCIGVGLSRLLPVIGVALVMGLVVALGLLALVVPGLILLTMYYAAVPAAIIERPGVMGALQRSADLTRGVRWRVFGLILVLGLLDGVIEYLAGAALKGSSSLEVVLVVPQLVGCVTAALTATGGAVTYYQLRLTKEGVDADQLARIFE